MFKLRPYQESAVEKTMEEWLDKQSTLIVAATGLGKTTIFSEIVKRMLPKRALILVHREELLKQAQDRLIYQSGIQCDIEKGDQRASTSVHSRAACVVATVQTLYSSYGEKFRAERFDPNDFGLLVCDEAHHYAAESYKKVIDHFRKNKDLKVLGVTATPDRADELALGQIFQSVAFDYEILDGIKDGWLVPVDQQMVHVNGLDFSNMKTTAGDLNGADLAEMMEKEEVLHGVASASIEIIGNKRSLAFTSSVRHAEMLSNIFNRHKPFMSEWICGKTPKEERSYKLEKFKLGETQIMVNCGVLTEGFDCPEVEVIIQARPTKSRCLYAQIIGRSLRPLPNLIDHLETPEDRRKKIQFSWKPCALVIDFVGNAGRHKLMSSADILGGNLSDDVIARAVKKAKEDGGPVRMSDTLEKSQEELAEEARQKKLEDAARKAKLLGKASFVKSSINPFDCFQIEPAMSRGWDEGKELSEKVKGHLLKAGINTEGLSYSQGNQLMGELIRRWKGGLASYKQTKFLKSKGYETKNMTRMEASALMTAWANNGWKRPEGNVVVTNKVAA